MTIYTHNSPINYDCTNIRMIVSDLPAAELGLDDSWYKVDAETVSDMEELCGEPYPKLEGWMLLGVDIGPNLERTERWGRL